MDICNAAAFVLYQYRKLLSFDHTFHQNLFHLSLIGMDHTVGHSLGKSSLHICHLLKRRIQLTQKSCHGYSGKAFIGRTAVEFQFHSVFILHLHFPPQNTSECFGNSS